MQIHAVDKFKQWVVDKIWYNQHPLRWMLFPLTLLYNMIVYFRRRFLQQFCQQHFPVPIIVVGNITVGGVGKTPFVIALAKQLQTQGIRVGIVSRGYGAGVSHFPHEVGLLDDAAHVGDEPLLLAKKTGCPVVIAPKRVEAVRYLLDKYQSQVVISDDGLQHYAMGRAVEIVVMDGVRGVGNGLCLPAGPLREGIGRLLEADFIVVNGASSQGGFQSRQLNKILNQSQGSTLFRMDLLPGEMMGLVGGKPIKLTELKFPIAAVAAIGHPERFFSLLKSMGLTFNAYPFVDHHQFHPEELDVRERVVVMTEKDAVKCESFATDRMYFLPVEAKVEDKFWDALWLHEHLQGVI